MTRDLASIASKCAADSSVRFRLLVVMLIGAQTTGTIATATLPSIAPHVAQTLGVPSKLIGYQISLIAAAMLISLAFGGNLGRRFGACRVTQIALVSEAIGALLCMAGTLPAIALGSVFMGLGYGTMTPAASQLLMRFTPHDKRNLVFSIKQTGVPLGGIVAAAMQPAIAVHIGWIYTLMLVAMIAIALALAMQVKRARWDDDRDRRVPLATKAHDGIGAIWRHPALRNLSLSGAALVIVQISLTTFTVALFVEDLGYSLIAAGFVLTVSQVGGVAGRIFWGWCADRLGNCMLALGLLCVLMGGSAAACAALSGSTPLAIVYLVFFILGATASGWNGAYLAEIARVSPPGSVGAATGASLFVVNVGKFAGPLLFAQALTWTESYRLMFAALALPSALALLFVVRAAYRTERTVAHDSPPERHAT